MLSEESLIEDAKEHPGRYAGIAFSKGDYKKGWEIYSHREKDLWGPSGRQTGLPKWQGQGLKDKTIVLGYEQALGEQILFSSYANDFLKMGANVTLEVDPRLVTLFRRSFPTCNIIPWQYPWHKDVKKGDYYTLLGNPGLYLRSKPEDFPKETKYLTAKPYDLQLFWQIKVGVSWWSPMGEKNVPLEDFSPLYNSDDISCVNLQYGQKGNAALIDPHIDLNNDLDTIAAVINACDYVVTISNTVAHLAGALGKPTYILLSKSKRRHLYWDLPFYPSVTRVDREEGQTWKETILKIKLDIENKANITMPNITVNTATGF
jgi:hypothetical protein